MVSVGTDHDTAGFAVATIRRWWQQAGHALYPNADRLLVTADAGGSDGYRVRAELDPGAYPLGVKVSDRELAAVPLRRHDWHGDWNYTVLPTAA